MKKRMLSLLLALVMCLSLMPTAVFAAEDGVEIKDTTSGTITVNFDSCDGSPVAPRTYSLVKAYGDLPTPPERATISRAGTAPPMAAATR